MYWTSGRRWLASRQTNITSSSPTRRQPSRTSPRSPPQVCACGAGSFVRGGNRRLPWQPLKKQPLYGVVPTKGYGVTASDFRIVCSVMGVVCLVFMRELLTVPPSPEALAPAGRSLARRAPTATVNPEWVVRDRQSVNARQHDRAGQIILQYWCWPSFALVLWVLLRVPARSGPSPYRHPLRRRRRRLDRSGPETR